MKCCCTVNDSLMDISRIASSSLCRYHQQRCCHTNRWSWLFLTRDLNSSSDGRTGTKTNVDFVKDHNLHCLVCITILIGEMLLITRFWHGNSVRGPSPLTIKEISPTWKQNLPLKTKYTPTPLKFSSVKPLLCQCYLRGFTLWRYS